MSTKTMQSRYIRPVLTLGFVLTALAVGSAAAQTGSATSQKGSAAARKGSEAAQFSSPAVSVFNSCSGGNAACTTTAVCPPGLTIQSGWSFYIVPDGSGPAYGICGTKSVSCVPGTGSCAVETAVEGCAAPGWWRQTALVSIVCGPPSQQRRRK
jgi:hypothetical protein